MSEPHLTATAAQGIFKLLGVAPKVYAKLRQWRGGPSSEDSARLVRYCRRLDERRVFSAPYNSEVEEMCVASLEQVKSYTDEALSELDHPLAQAAVGAIFDELRGFIQKWHGHRAGRRWPPHHWSRDHGEQERDFFQDLGELRGRMRIFVGMLTELVPDAKAPRLLGDE
jgi:hypothetical protein